jgi:NAD(P)-dependent dehydrogenase (short-subunit alcohol dehydrogenase family)
MQDNAPVAIVTGASTGIGYRTARNLVLRGYTVVIATRSPQAGQLAAENLNIDAARAPHSSRGSSFLEGGSPFQGSALFLPLDVSKLSSVRNFADGLPASLRSRLHVLVLNAGISGFGLSREQRKTGDDFETIFATNFLGHFFLARLLLEALRETAARQVGPGCAPVRVVALASVTHRLLPDRAPDWAAVIAGRGGNQYAHSKLAALLLAGRLQRELVGTGVQAVAVNPGAVNSDIWRAISPGTACWFRPFMRAFFLTPEQGSATSVAAATAVEVGGARLDAPGGALLYLSPYSSPAWAQRAGGWAALLFDALGPFRGASPMLPTRLATDEKAADALWAACEAALARTQVL